MFCPACGFEERQARAFCRKCGGDLRQVLAALQNPDSADGSGRDDVYRALAARIKESKPKDVKELVEEVLPKIERRVGDRTGRALSGAISSGGAGAARLRVERFRDQSARQVLSAQRGGQEAAATGNRKLESARLGNRAGAGYEPRGGIDGEQSKILL
jgi:hypothetical protein